MQQGSCQNCCQVVWQPTNSVLGAKIRQCLRLGLPVAWPRRQDSIHLLSLRKTEAAANASPRTNFGSLVAAPDASPVLLGACTWLEPSQAEIGAGQEVSARSGWKILPCGWGFDQTPAFF